MSLRSRRCRRSLVVNPTSVSRGLLGGVELALDELEAGAPEARIREVDSHDLTELLRRPRAARAQQVEIRRDEALALLLVPAVDGEREQVAVGVRVDVAGRVDEVPDIRPPDAVVVVELDAVAEEVRLRREPQLVEAVDRQLASLAAV